MDDCVSVMAFTLVGDEKSRLGERRISATGRFLLLLLEAEWNCVGGSGGHFSKSARNGAPPVVSVDVKKTNPRYTSPFRWPTRYLTPRMLVTIMNLCASGA